MSDDKKIFIDDDWKSQVAAEKEALKQEATTAQQPAGRSAASGTSASGTSASVQPSKGQPSTGQPSTGQRAADSPMPMPPASLEMLVTTLATEAMVALGQFPNPATQEVSLSPEHAGYAIDMLAMLEEKTKGNLTPAEATMITDLLHQLRMMFVTMEQSSPRTE